MNSPTNNIKESGQSTSINDPRSKSARIDMDVDNVKDNESLKKWVNGIAQQYNLTLKDVTLGSNIITNNQTLSFELDGVAADQNAKDVLRSIKEFAGKTSAPFELKKGKLVLLDIKVDEPRLFMDFNEAMDFLDRGIL